MARARIRSVPESLGLRILYDKARIIAASDLSDCMQGKKPRDSPSCKSDFTPISHLISHTSVNILMVVVHDLVIEV